MEIHHLRIRITGIVQGVSFRSSARRQADQLGLHGFAQNQADGSVYIEVEGSHENLQQFLAWCREGSPSATVESVEYTVHEPQGYQGFEKR